MSIILDALKRSDRERRLQKPPDLSQIYQENHQPRKKTLVWVLLIGVVLLAGLLVAYLLFQKDPGTENTKALEKKAVEAGKGKNSSGTSKTLRKFSVKSEKNKTVQKQKNSGSASRRSVAPVPSRRRPRRHTVDQRTTETVQGDSEDTAAESPLAAILARATRAREEVAAPEKDDSPEGTHPLAALFSGVNRSHDETAGTETAVPSSAKREGPAPNPEINAPAPAREQIASLSKPGGVSIAAPEAAQVERSGPVSENQQAQKEAPEQDSVSVPSAPEKRKATVVSKGGKISLMDDLPYETRQKYEDLQINVHIYDEKSAERRVFINMHSYKEGEKIGEAGPVLVAIIPEGIIVDYGEGKVQMNVRK